MRNKILSISLLTTSLGLLIACAPFFGDRWHVEEFERLFSDKDMDTTEIEVELSNLYGDGLDYVCVLWGAGGYHLGSDTPLAGNLERAKELIGSRYRNSNSYDFHYILVSYANGDVRSDRVHVASRHWAFKMGQIYDHCFDPMQTNVSIRRAESGHGQGGLYYVLSIVSDEA